MRVAGEEAEGWALRYLEDSPDALDGFFREIGLAGVGHVGREIEKGLFFVLIVRGNDELTRDIESMLKAKDALSSSIVSACTTLKDRSRLFFSALPGEDPFAPPTPGRMPF